MARSALLVVMCVCALVGVAKADNPNPYGPCSVDARNQVIGPGNVFTASCPTPDSAYAYEVTADQAFSVYLTNGTDCTAPTFAYLPFFSTQNKAPGAFARFGVPAFYTDDLIAPICIRVKNLNDSLTMNANVSFIWYTKTYPNQWHLHNTGQYLGVPGNDVNIIPAWNAGYNGSGVIVDIVDDGLQAAHVEIASRFRLDLSYNYQTSTADPTGLVTDTHGTGCGGVAGAEINNGYCGQGAAFGAQLAGHRVLFTGVTNGDYFAALYAPTHISSNSWGPANACGTFFLANSLITAAIVDGAQNGRGGKGKSYVFAAGNDGQCGGDTNQYWFTKMKEVIAVAGSTFQGERTYYSSAGACLFVNAPTQGLSASITYPYPGIITAQGGSANDQCRDDFGGTSSATPLVSGIIALIMQAQPAVTNRDVQYILRASAFQNAPTDGSWFTNGAGIPYSRFHGFGRVDAGAAIAIATHVNWTTVAPLFSYTGAVQTNAGPIIGGGVAVTRMFTVPAVNSVMYIEHVTLAITANYPKLTDIRMRLRSPANTLVDVLVPQESGDPPQPYSPTLYPFGIRAFWGESSIGTWTLEMDAPAPSVGTGELTEWQLLIYGTSTNLVPVPTGGPSSTAVPAGTASANTGGNTGLSGANAAAPVSWIVTFACAVAAIAVAIRVA